MTKPDGNTNSDLFSPFIERVKTLDELCRVHVEVFDVGNGDSDWFSPFRP